MTIVKLRSLSSDRGKAQWWMVGVSMVEHKGIDVTSVYSLAGKLRLEDDRLKSRLVNRLALYLSLGAVLFSGVITVHNE
jgi:hypothetical protein